MRLISIGSWPVEFNQVSVKNRISMFSSKTKSAITSDFPSLHTDRAFSKQILSLSGVGLHDVMDESDVS